LCARRALTSRCGYHSTPRLKDYIGEVGATTGGKIRPEILSLVHPLVGLNLFVLATISSAPIGEVIRGILPFLILLLIVLGIITYVPILTLWLPDAVFG